MRTASTTRSARCHPSIWRCTHYGLGNASGFAPTLPTRRIRHKPGRRIRGSPGGTRPLLQADAELDEVGVPARRFDLSVALRIL